MPNVAIGQWIGYRSRKMIPAVKPSRIHRPLPTCCEVPFYAQCWFTTIVCSLFCSACVIAEVYYLVTSVWRRQYYFMYFYLGISLCIMSYVSSAVSIVQSYITLSVGLYNWWWRSFVIGLFVSIHLFIFCWHFNYFTDKAVDISIHAEMCYIIWTGMLCLLVGLIAGTTSFLGSFYFIKTIYAKAQEGKSK